VVAVALKKELRQQAESRTYTLAYADTASIPSSLRGYVAVAVQYGLIKADGAQFNPPGTFTRLDLAVALAQLASM